MTVTILAFFFIVLVLMVAVFGFKAIIKQGKTPEDLNKEQCSVCRQKFSRAQLIERQVADYRVLYFCPACIQSLYGDLTSKN